MEVEELIKKSCINLISLYRKSPDCSQKLIFDPNYNSDKDKGTKKERYSEQELKQIFLENLIRDYDNKLFYSVETQTPSFYNFKNTNSKTEIKEPLCARQKGKGFTTARIDISVYNNKHKLQNHIEFKYGNPDEFCIKKDFLKLVCDPVDLENLNKDQKSYFVHYAKANKRTLSSILEKMKNSIEYVSGIECLKNDKINDRMKNVIVYLLLLDTSINKEDKVYVFSLKNLSDLDLKEVAEKGNGSYDSIDNINAFLKKNF